MKNSNFFQYLAPQVIDIKDIPHIYVTDFNKEGEKAFYLKFLELTNNQKVKVIPILISSYGGEVYSLLSMLDIIASSKKPVATIAMGKAMSCGSILLAAGSKGYRYAAPSATVMIHEVSSWSGGKTTEVKNSVKETERLNQLIFKFYAKQAGKPSDYFIKELKKRNNTDWHLTSAECKKLGLVDHVGLPGLD